MTNPRSAAREMARRLLERETTGATEAAGLAAAMQRSCTRLSENLRRSVGHDGYNALIARALLRTQTDQPVLKDIRRATDGDIQLDVVPSVERHGAATVHAALESLFAALVDILSDLIGADMVQNLLDHDAPLPPRRPGEQEAV